VLPVIVGQTSQALSATGSEWILRLPFCRQVQCSLYVKQHSTTGHPQAHLQQELVTLSRSVVSTVEFEINESCLVGGIVVDERGLPVPDATLQVAFLNKTSMDGSPWTASLELSDEGRFFLYEKPTTRFRLGAKFGSWSISKTVWLPGTWGPGRLDHMIKLDLSEFVELRVLHGERPLERFQVQRGSYLFGEAPEKPLARHQLGVVRLPVWKRPVWKLHGGSEKPPPGQVWWTLAWQEPDGLREAVISVFEASSPVMIDVTALNPPRLGTLTISIDGPQPVNVRISQIAPPDMPHAALARYFGGSLGRKRWTLYGLPPGDYAIRITNSKGPGLLLETKKTFGSGANEFSFAR